MSQAPIMPMATDADLDIIAELSIELEELRRQDFEDFLRYSIHPPRRRQLPDSVRKEVFAAAGGVCTYCGVVLVHEPNGHPNQFTVDHIEPVVQGGSDDPCNLTAACRSCNSRKGAR